MMRAEHCLCHPEEIASKFVLWMKEEKSASHDIPSYTLMPTTNIKNLDELKNIYDGLGQLEMTDWDIANGESAKIKIKIFIIR